MTSDAPPLTQPTLGRALRFGRFSLDPARKLLLADGGAVRLGGRALELLIALVERAGEVVSHRDLFARVWPHTVVEESSLRVHMSALRKALGDGGDTRYIASVPGRGYSFVMQVVEWLPGRTMPADVPASAPEASAVSPPPSLPFRLTGIIGREDVLDTLAAKLQQRRLVTLVGSGGIGKTTVALALAHRVARRQAHGALFVDLAPLGDPSLVPAALAAALRVPAPAQDPWPTLEAALAARDVLVVLDNCEHVIVAAAMLAERVLRAAPRVRILATSREPLEAESEAIHRLESLAVPLGSTELDMDAALAFPALRLFVERATASADDFVLSQANLAPIVRLCRHLDGVPLAIELAAARVGSLGLHALAGRLDDVFRLLRRGRRTVLPRHQTLQALLDWSHGLLDDDERTVLHRLSTFRSSFTLAAAADVASCERIARGTAVACVLGLVSKSLVEFETGEVPRYRLLFVTRLYAQGKLADEGEAREVARRHAACFRDLHARATAELGAERVSLSAWLATHASAMPDIRAALDWAEGPDGDKLLGAELVVESSRLALELGLNDELLQRALEALATVRAQTTVSHQLELRLLNLLCLLGGGCLTDRDIPPETATQLEELAQRVGSPLQQRAALQALCIEAFGRGDYPSVVAHAARFGTLPPDPDDPLDAESELVRRRFGALVAHYLGDHRSGWTDSARALEQAEVPRRGHLVSQMPVQLAMGVLQARILWLQGSADRALERSLGVLTAADGAHPFGLSQVMAMAVIPILVWRGDDERALAYVDRLAQHALRHCQSFWLAWVHGFCKALALRGRDVEDIRRRLGPGSRRTNAMASDMLATLAPELAGPDQLARVEAGIVGWCAPEILRVHGERLAWQPERRARAEAVLVRALALARQQGARAWELRAATSVAMLWHATGRGDAARDLLASAVALYTEGLDGVDMRRAQALLAGWRAVS